MIVLLALTLRCAILTGGNGLNITARSALQAQLCRHRYTKNAGATVTSNGCLTSIFAPVPTTRTTPNDSSQLEHEARLPLSRFWRHHQDLAPHPSCFALDWLTALGRRFRSFLCDSATPCSFLLGSRLHSSCALSFLNFILFPYLYFATT